MTAAKVINMFRNEYVININNKCCLSLNSECVPGHFGLSCKERCSGHCINNDPCDHVSGVCPGGCQVGYVEEYCNSCKKPIYLLLNDIL